MIDFDVIEEFLRKLTDYFSEEGFTYINIYEAFMPAWEIFEKLLHEGVEEDEKI